MVLVTKNGVHVEIVPGRSIAVGKDVEFPDKYVLWTEMSVPVKARMEKIVKETGDLATEVTLML